MDSTNSVAKRWPIGVLYLSAEVRMRRLVMMVMRVMNGRLPLEHLDHVELSS